MHTCAILCRWSECWSLFGVGFCVLHQVLSDSPAVGFLSFFSLFLSFGAFFSFFFFFFFFFLYMFLHVLFAAWSCSARHSLRTALLHQWKRNRPWKEHVKRSQAQAAHRYLGTLTFTSHLACTSHPAARVWGSAQVRKSNKYFLREFPS